MERGMDAERRSDGDAHTARRPAESRIVHRAACGHGLDGSSGARGTFPSWQRCPSDHRGPADLTQDLRADRIARVSARAADPQPRARRQVAARADLRSWEEKDDQRPQAGAAPCDSILGKEAWLSLSKAVQVLV